jgi:hypothetical protein
MQLAKSARAEVTRRLASVRHLWPPRAIPTAICLCLGALAFLLAWWLGDIDSLDAWTPNIVVGLLVLATTITFVEWIIQREASERSKPRRERALDVLSNVFVNFAFNAYTDIVFTNIRVDVADLNIPSDPVAIFEFWVKAQDTKDTPRPRAGGRSLLLSEGLQFVSSVQQVADADRELLPSELVVAIDNLNPIFTGDSLFDMAEDVSQRDRRGMDDWLLFGLMPAAGRFGQALRVVAGDRVRPLWSAS